MTPWSYIEKVDSGFTLNLGKEIKLHSYTKLNGDDLADLKLTGKVLNPGNVNFDLVVLLKNLEKITGGFSLERSKFETKSSGYLGMISFFFVLFCFVHILSKNGPSGIKLIGLFRAPLTPFPSNDEPNQFFYEIFLKHGSSTQMKIFKSYVVKFCDRMSPKLLHNNT